VPEKRISQIDRSNSVVTAGMLMLALLGVATVFHEPIVALFAPAAATAAAPAAPSAEPTPPQR
jgi:hypothetical protein